MRLIYLQNKIGKLLKEKPSVEWTYCLKRKKGEKERLIDMGSYGMRALMH